MSSTSSIIQTTHHKNYSLILTDDPKVFSFHSKIFTNLQQNFLHFCLQDSVDKFTQIPHLLTNTSYLFDIFPLSSSKKSPLEKFLPYFTNNNLKVLIVISHPFISNLAYYQQLINQFPQINFRILVIDGIFGLKYLNNHFLGFTSFPSSNTRRLIFTAPLSFKPLHYQDYQSAFSKSLLSPNTQNQTFFVQGKESLSPQNLQNFFKIHYPNLKIKITALPEIKPSLFSKSHNFLNFQPKYSFSAYLKKLYPKKSQAIQKKNPSISAFSFSAFSFLRFLHSRQQKPYRFLAKFFKLLQKTALAIFLALFLFIGSFLIVFLSSLLQIKYSLDYLKSGNYSLSQVHSQTAYRHLQLLTSVVNHIPAALIPQEISANYPYLDTAVQASQLIIQVDQLVPILTKLTTSNSLNPDLHKLASDLQSLHLHTTRLLSGLPSSRPLIFSPLITDSDYHLFLDFLHQGREVIPQITPYLEYYPYLSGLDHPLEIVFLLQNNNELRPTGGFIGSFVRATITHGSLSNWQLYDIYDADGQLKGYVPPPAPIAQILNQPSWYLRDSNWEPDFPSSAKTALWFLNKELNFKPDMVVAINLSYIEKLIEPLTPFSLATVEQPITATNLHQVLQSTIEDNFVPGSTVKKQLLTDLSTKLIDYYSHPNPKSLNHLMLSTSQAISSREAQIYSTNSDLQSLLETSNWSGRLVLSPQFPTSAQISFAEANLGVNKANQYIDRTLSLDIEDLSQFQKINLTLTYHNNSQIESKQAGTYRNYIRLYLPPDSQVDQVVQTSPTDTLALDPDLRLEPSYLELGFYLPVPLQSSRQVTISFTTKSLKTTPSSLLIRKQSGTSSDPLTIHISSPRKIDLTSPFSSQPNRPESSLTQGASVIYNTHLSTDKLIIFN